MRRLGTLLDIVLRCCTAIETAPYSRFFRAILKPQQPIKPLTMTANQLLRKMNILTPYKKEDVIAGLAVMVSDHFGNEPWDYGEANDIPWTHKSPDTEDDNFSVRCDFIEYGMSWDLNNLVILARKSPMYLIEEAFEQLLKISLTYCDTYFTYTLMGMRFMEDLSFHKYFGDPLEGTFDAWVAKNNDAMKKRSDSPVGHKWYVEAYNKHMTHCYCFGNDLPYSYLTWDEILNVYKDGTMTECGEKAIKESFEWKMPGLLVS